MAVVSACLLWNPVLCNRIRAGAAGTMGICGIFVLLPVFAGSNHRLYKALSAS